MTNVTQLPKRVVDVAPTLQEMALAVFRETLHSSRTNVDIIQGMGLDPDTTTELYHFAAYLDPLRQCMVNSPIRAYELKLTDEQRPELDGLRFAIHNSDNVRLVTFDVYVCDDGVIDPTLTERHFLDDALIHARNTNPNHNGVVARHLNPVLNNLVDFGTLSCNQLTVTDTRVQLSSLSRLVLRKYPDGQVIHTAVDLNPEMFTLDTMWSLGTPVKKEEEVNENNSWLNKIFAYITR